MTDPLQIVFILLVLLQIKHLFADFVLQTKRMMTDRGAYLHFGRLHHSALHAVFSAVCFFAVGADAGFVLLICALEAVVHFHIDWVKGWHSDWTGYSTEDAGYWRAFGMDQLLHQMTYIGMIWVWVV